MKFIHLSDLHLGKRVNEFSLLEDQQHILQEVLKLVDEECPDAVLIAGDVYDKSIPPAEAVRLFDDFLYELSRRNVQVFIISGNHDSAERIAFAGRLMNKSGIYISPVYQGNIEPVSLTDTFGTVNIYLLPFLKPAHVRRFYEEETIETYTDALRIAIQQFNINPEERNVLVTHQFVTGASRSESEEISVGGSDNVDASVFEGFDYVALGHLHAPQNIGSEKIRYCGTLLKYSFSEAKHKKSVTIVTLGKKGDISIRTRELHPLHDMRELKGSYLELTAKSYYKNTNTNDYLHITLTDEDDIPDAVGKLRIIYPNLMKLDYDNRRTRANITFDAAAETEFKSPLALFSEFYEKQNNQPMSEEQKNFINELIENIWEE